jgi:hypothetical protein
LHKPKASAIRSCRKPKALERMSDYKNTEPRTKNTVKDYFSLGPVAGYFFRKKDPNAKPNFNLRMMHGINKISMIMFLVGIIVLIIKLAFRS